VTVVCERSTEPACTLRDLAPETDYELYCYVVAGGHTFRSETISFTTLEKGEEPEPTPDGKVVFGTLTVSERTATSATAAVTYTCEGEATVTDAGFLLKKAGQSDETRQSCGTAATSLRYTFTGLSENTSYEVAAYVRHAVEDLAQHGRRVHHRGRRRHAARQQYPPQRLGGTAERSVERRLPLRRP